MKTRTATGYREMETGAVTQDQEKKSGAVTQDQEIKTGVVEKVKDVVAGTFEKEKAIKKDAFENTKNGVETAREERPCWARCETNLPGAEVEKRFRLAAKSLQRSEAPAAFYLAEIDDRRIWRELGYSSVIAYASAVVGFAMKKTYALLNIGRRLRELPVLRTAFDEDRISWTKVRELVRLKGSFGEEKMLERARASSNRDLEQFISESNERARRLKRAAIAKLEKRQEGLFDDNEIMFPELDSVPAGDPNLSVPVGSTGIPEPNMLPAGDPNLRGSDESSNSSDQHPLPVEIPDFSGADESSSTWESSSTRSKAAAKGVAHLSGENAGITKSSQLEPLCSTRVSGGAEVPGARVPAAGKSSVQAGSPGSTISVTLKFTPEEYAIFKETGRIWKHMNRPAWKQERMVISFAGRFFDDVARASFGETIDLTEREVSGTSITAPNESPTSEAVESSTAGSSGLSTGKATGSPSDEAAGCSAGKAAGSPSKKTTNEQVAFFNKEKTTEENPGHRETGKSVENEGHDTGSPGNTNTAFPVESVKKGKSGKPVVDSPFNLFITQCPDCRKITMAGKFGDRIEVEKSLLERALCDGAVHEVDAHGLPGRKKRSVSPALRKKIFMRDGGVCRVPGCGGTSLIEVHHVKPLSKGGGNDPSNLLLACSLCHKNIHEGRLLIKGVYPEFDFLHVGKIG